MLASASMPLTAAHACSPAAFAGPHRLEVSAHCELCGPQEEADSGGLQADIKPGAASAHGAPIALLALVTSLAALPSALTNLT